MTTLVITPDYFVIDKQLTQNGGFRMFRKTVKLRHINEFGITLFIVGEVTGIEYLASVLDLNPKNIKHELINNKPNSKQKSFYGFDEQMHFYVFNLEETEDGPEVTAKFVDTSGSFQTLGSGGMHARGSYIVDNDPVKAVWVASLHDSNTSAECTLINRKTGEITNDVFRPE